jgi:hypothetical protein
MSNYTKLLQGKERDEYISKRTAKFKLEKMMNSKKYKANIKKYILERIDVTEGDKKYADGEEIEFSGFNTQSGYVYIALSNGVQIISNFGQEVEFLITDYETEEEIFMDTYTEALEYNIDKLN